VLLRRLGLQPDEQEMSESVRARLAAVEAALRELDELAATDGPDQSQIQALRQVLELRQNHLCDLLGTEPAGASDISELRLRLLDVERRTLRGLHDRGEISRRTMIDISQELDSDEHSLRRRPSG
jgi:CPA1 family monovalent cation:H+ antiporter